MKKLRKSDIKPGDTLRNLQSRRIGIAMASEKDPNKLHEKAADHYVRVQVDTKKGIREVPRYIENLEKVS